MDSAVPPAAGPAVGRRAAGLSTFDCQRQTPVMTGAIFEGTRRPLRLWFQASWLAAIEKLDGSALGLQRVLGITSIRDPVGNAMRPTCNQGEAPTGEPRPPSHCPSRFPVLGPFFRACYLSQVGFHPETPVRIRRWTRSPPCCT